MRVPSLVLIGLVALSMSPVPRRRPATAALRKHSAPTPRSKPRAGRDRRTIQIQIQRYTPDFDRKSVETALKGGGYPAFLTALRKAPEVGSVGIGDQKFAIRYAREQKTAKGRTIVVVTDKPVFFVGGGRADAKPRAGYEVARHPADGRRRRARQRHDGGGRAHQAWPASVGVADRRLRRRADQAGDGQPEDALISSSAENRGSRRGGAGPATAM